MNLHGKIDVSRKRARTNRPICRFSLRVQSPRVSSSDQIDRIEWQVHDANREFNSLRFNDRLWPLCGAQHNGHYVYCRIMLIGFSRERVLPMILWH